MGFPIAECFVSPQGEGTHTGRLMIFLRLAGCTVGTRYPAERYAYNMGVDISIESGGGSTFFPILPEYTNECHLYDGRTFACDTDYKKKMSLNGHQLLDLLQATHKTCRTICLTGGEPMMHKQNFYALVQALYGWGYKLHLETSGTIVITEEMVPVLKAFEHVSVSPKLGFLEDQYLTTEIVQSIDVKLLIDESFNIHNLPARLHSLCTRGIDGINAFIQPVNAEHTVNVENLKRCLDLQLKYPHLKLSTQSHKSWGVQ